MCHDLIRALKVMLLLKKDTAINKQLTLMFLLEQGQFGLDIENQTVLKFNCIKFLKLSVFS